MAKRDIKKQEVEEPRFFFLFYEHQFSSMNHILGKKYASFQLIDMLPGQAVSNELLLGLVKCPNTPSGLVRHYLITRFGVELPQINTIP